MRAVRIEICTHTYVLIFRALVMLFAEDIMAFLKEGIYI